jgi:hypothetical protein
VVPADLLTGVKPLESRLGAARANNNGRRLDEDNSRYRARFVGHLVS